MKKQLKTIGWREWVCLPELDIERIKIKVDTGARTSSLHAYDLVFSTHNGVAWVEYKVHPKQRNTASLVKCRSEVVEYRKVRSSNGHSEMRPVIFTSISLLGDKWPIEITLTNRDAMGFRMLLGRESIKKRFLVDVGKSYCDKKLTKVTT